MKVKSWVFLIQVLFPLLWVFVSSAETLLPVETPTQEDKRAFLDTLSAYLKELDQIGPDASSAINEDFKKRQDELAHFSKKFPESRFADDSQLIYMLRTFEYWAKNGDAHKCQAMIDEMQRLVEEFQGQQLELETREEIAKDSPHNSAFCIPYDKILSFMRGYMAFWGSKDYQTSIKEASYLKDNLDFSVDQTGGLAEAIYGQVMASYMDLWNATEALKVAEEAKFKFPDKTWPQEYIDLIEKKQAQGWR